MQTRRSVDTDHGTVQTDVFIPTVGMSGFYGYAWQAFRQNRGFIGGILAVEYIGRRHGNNAHGDTLFCQYLLRFQSQFNFRAGCNYNNLRLTLSFTDYVSTAFDVVQLLLITRLEFQVLTAEIKLDG